MFMNTGKVTIAKKKRKKSWRNKANTKEKWPPMPTLLWSRINQPIPAATTELPATASNCQPLPQFWSQRRDLCSATTLEPKEELVLLSSYFLLVPSISRTHQKESSQGELRNVACRLLTFDIQKSTEERTRVESK